MHPFTNEHWESALTHLGAVVSPADLSRLRSSVTARLVAAIPYLSGSEDADRFAVSNLLTLWAAIRTPALFGHRADDDADLFRRLSTFHVGNHADPLVVDYGLTLLALISLRDHQTDAAADRASGKSNPVASGAWNADELTASLTKELDQHPNLKAAYTEAVPGCDVQGVWS